MHALAVRELEHALHDVLLRVEDDVVRPMRLRERGLLRGARRADDGRAARLDELREDEAEPARDGVHEHDVAFLDVVRLGHEGERGRAWGCYQLSAIGSEEGRWKGVRCTLEEGCGGYAGREVLWERVHLVPGDADVLRECTQSVLEGMSSTAGASRGRGRTYGGNACADLQAAQLVLFVVEDVLISGEGDDLACSLPAQRLRELGDRVEALPATMPFIIP